MAKIVVVGAGMCGLASAIMLADDGHQVTVLERDPSPPPTDLEDAFGWKRQGVGQFGLAHLLQPRGTSILREQIPRAYELLDQNGGLHMNLVKPILAIQTDSEIEPEDDRFDLLTGRRGALEWAMATTAAEHPSVEVRRGEAVAGLLTGSPLSDSVPHVTGLRLKSGGEVEADLVIDATGRNSPTPRWLTDIGAQPPAESGEDSGFVYYNRFFRSDDGSTPMIMAPILSGLGSFSILTIPADNGTWSVTLYTLSDDKPLRRFRDPDIFERVLQANPRHAHWLDGEPITDVVTMAGGVDRHSEFVIDGRPCATGLLTVADASSCTNPSLGRGISLGLMHVETLRAAVADHLDDPTTLAVAFSERSRTDVLPYHDATTAADRQRNKAMLLARDGETPEITPEQRIPAVINARIGSDPVAARAFGDIGGCLALPQEVLARPGVLDHLEALAETTEFRPMPGPDRSELLELVA